MVSFTALFGDRLFPENHLLAFTSQGVGKAVFGDAKVIPRGGLNLDFLDRRDAQVARQRQLDIGRLILQHFGAELRRHFVFPPHGINQVELPTLAFQQGNRRRVGE